MLKFHWAVLPIVYALGVIETGAALAANFTYVISTGSDANSCDRANPCGSINGAIDKTDVSGSIVCLDEQAAYPVIITKSVNIDCGGHTQTFRDNNARPGITINIPVSNSDTLRTVRIRGVVVAGAVGPGRYLPRGIDIISANVVILDDVDVTGNVQQGIYDHRTGGQTRLYVRNSTISNNGGAGIVAASSAVGITVLENVRLENNAYGLATGAGNNVVINRSVISGNTTAGVEADPGAQVEVVNSMISHNNIGVQAGGTVRLRENDIKFSNTAIQGGTISFGANRFSGNGAYGNIPSLVSGAPADLFN